MSADPMADPDIDDLTLDVDALADAVEFLETSVPHAVEAMASNLPGLAQTLDVLRTWRKRLADLEAYVEAKTSLLAKEQGVLKAGMTLPDGRRVEFKGGAKRHDWDTDRVLVDVTTKSMELIHVHRDYRVIDEHGVMPCTLGEVVSEVRADLVKVLPDGRNSMRSTHLKRLGLTPSDYCETVESRRTVHIVGAP